MRSQLIAVIAAVSSFPVYATEKEDSVEHLRELVVIAREATGMTSSSRIGRDAMSHLQPSSFTDILELLPGNISKNPAMGKVNSIQLRETGNIGPTGAVADNADYAISSLGTLFTVDGAPVNNDAGHQSVGIEAAVGRNAVNRGVDMRTLSTDNIESVEIVRGIPSAEYGNLTSGLVNIRRIRRAVPWSVRFKADGYSKLLFAGKGFTFGPENRHNLNADIGWLDSKIDPRNNLENFRRVSASLRAFFQWNVDNSLVEWTLSTDYTGTVDRVKTDPDLSLTKIDEYRADNSRFSLASDLNISTRGMKWLKSISFKSAVSYEKECLRRRRQMAPSRPLVAPVSMDEGVNDGTFILDEYIADYLSDGRPFSAYCKLALNGKLPGTDLLWQNYKLGADWSMSKNYGHGQVYDPMRPLSASWTSRPRDYRDIPAVNVVSFFAEDDIKADTRLGNMQLLAGVHGIALVGLPARYTLSGKMYLDPRVNARWNFPRVWLSKTSVGFWAGGGFGLGTRMPTADYLFPQAAYLDIVQLNYYDTHSPKDLSRINLRTYINDATNYGLRPARNLKWEVSAGFNAGGNSFYLTYFEERMNSGFRYSTVYRAYDYVKYDASVLLGQTLTAPPSLESLPSTDERVLRGYRRAENGSRIDKRGVEFQLKTARWRPLATSMIVSGAWFRTRYSNSQMLFDPVDDVYDGIAVSDRFVGLYNTVEGRVNEQLNTNFMFDTQLPKFGLVLTTTIQCMWYVKTRRLPQNGIPVAYMSADDGLMHDFTGFAETPALQYLVQDYNPALYSTYTIPTAMYVNLKASKTIGRSLKIAVFVNRIVDYLPDFKSNGLTVRRSSDAYFGMELNLTL